MSISSLSGVLGITFGLPCLLDPRLRRRLGLRLQGCLKRDRDLERERRQLRDKQCLGVSSLRFLDDIRELEDRELGLLPNDKLPTDTGLLETGLPNKSDEPRDI